MNHKCQPMIPPAYIVLFRGDDSDFVGNQSIYITLDTELSLEGCKAHFRFLDFTQDFDEIPEDKKLLLVFPKDKTAKFPLGAMDASLTLEDSLGRIRTASNRIHIVVTNSVREAYFPDDPQSVSVVISANKYIEDAEVSADGKTLTLSKKDGTEVSFSGGGTNDYNDLENKPSINGTTLTGNINLATPEQLLLKADKTNVYTKTEVDEKVDAVDNKADEAYSAAEQMVNAVNSLASTIGTHIRDTKNPHKVTAAQVGAVALNARSTVGSSFSVQYHAATGEGDDFSFGIGSGPSGKTFLFDKLYCSGKNRFFADGIVLVNETSATGASILDRITEYGGDFKSALDEVKGLIKADAATMASLAPEYSPSSAYSVGAFVYHDGNIYQCTTAIADGGEAWNAEHWELRKLDDFFTESNSLLTGTIDARLPYPLNPVTDETGLLKDRAINTTSLASVTVPDDFTDLLVRASVASSLAVTMPAASATKYGDTFPAEAGEYLITITKTGTAEAYVRTIKLEDVA